MTIHKLIAYAAASLIFIVGVSLAGALLFLLTINIVLTFKIIGIAILILLVFMIIKGIADRLYYNWLKNRS